ncbi:MAG: LPXTG cell wall anchor domain-containing protein [Clostridiaceae bacterium]
MIQTPGNYLNTVEFKGGAADQTSSGTQNGVWYASGSAWGTVEIKKLDNDSNAVKEEVASSETQSATSQAQSGILSLPETGGFMNATLLIIAGLISIITGIVLTLMKKTKH